MVWYVTEDITSSTSLSFDGDGGVRWNNGVEHFLYARNVFLQSSFTGDGLLRLLWRGLFRIPIAVKVTALKRQLGILPIIREVPTED